MNKILQAAAAMWPDPAQYPIHIPRRKDAVKNGKAPVDYMFHLWGEQFMDGLTDKVIDGFRLKRWQQLLGKSMTHAIVMDAVHAAVEFKQNAFVEVTDG